MSSHRPSISIFFPFLNDWGTVGSLVALAIQTAEKYTDDWEVILIDDGSTKENWEALEMIVSVILNSFQDLKGMPKQVRHDINKGSIRIIHHEKNRGYGGALRSGFENATKDLIFYTDCDAQYDPRELALLMDAMNVIPAKAGIQSFEKYNKGIDSRLYGNDKKVGMVNGYKIKRNDPWFRIVAGRIYHHLVKFAFRLPIRDTDCDFRLVRKEVFETVRLFENTGTICVELVKKIDHAGFRIAEVPVHHYWRTSGKSQFFNFARLSKTAMNLGKLWWKLMVQKHYQS